MLIPQVPINQPINTNTGPAEQQLSAQPSGEIRQMVKEIFLRHLINGTIKRNERLDVRTDVLITDLSTGRPIVVHGEHNTHYAASINKLPIALLVLEDLRAGRLTLDQTMTWQSNDVRGGFGDLDQPGAPLQASLQDVIVDLLKRSGNTATRVLVNGALGGAQEVNTRFESKPQLAKTALVPLSGNLFWLGDTAPSDALWSLGELMRQRDGYSDVMRDAMATNIFTDFGVRDVYKEGKGLTLVNKIGLLDDPEGNNRHDVGIVYSESGKAYGYAMFTTAPWQNAEATARADKSLKIMGRYTLRFADSRHYMQTQEEPAVLNDSALPAQEGRIVY